MSTNEIIKKLANAVRNYRGQYVDGSNPRRWVHAPQPDKINRIRELLSKLPISEKEQQEAVEAIDKFRHFDDFRAWMKKLSP
jgi:hypothetical protein